ncbi:hypothetical protein J6TS2_39550 [Heyndrickxia sporothermodurans]|nr:hypothetical protein J6TS2_39550 [Heyndrickxia sporothermodurans]
MLLTKNVEEKYNITRQTLYNWVTKGVISEPLKDEKSRNIWSEENQKEIERILNEKEQLSLDLQIPEKLHIQNRRYLGSKQKMLNFIFDVVSKNTVGVETIADIFGGTGVVANMFREHGKSVIVNDILYSNYTSFVTWFGNEPIDEKKVEMAIIELNDLKGIDGYVTKNFGNRYFSVENAQKIDAVREKIEDYTDFNLREKSFLITSLLYAMDKGANTVGHYDAYRQKMDSLKPLTLRMPVVNHSTNNEVYNMDANLLVREIKADLVYIDPPYNSRGYESAYHVLENVAEWKKPEVEGLAMKAVNRSEKSSDYTKRKAPEAFDDLIQHINSKYIVVSYNNMAKKGNSRSNAKISNEEIILSLEKRGKVTVFETDFNPFTTGKSIIQNHKELLYLCEVGAMENA